MKPEQKPLSSEQCKDAGLALVLINLLCAFAFEPRYFLPAALVLLVIAMSIPRLFHPFARLWFGVSHALGTVVSRVLLTLLFFLLVAPVGLLRRAMGKDAMQLKTWKTGQGSVFQDREHLFTRDDLDHPY